MRRKLGGSSNNGTVAPRFFMVVLTVSVTAMEAMF